MTALDDKHLLKTVQKVVNYSAHTLNYHCISGTISICSYFITDYSPDFYKNFESTAWILIDRVCIEWPPNLSRL